MRKMTVHSIDATIYPEDVIGPFLPVTSYDVDVFSEVLGDEVESAYTSSICCCDNCYDDFRAHWPGVAFRDLDFQSQSIELCLFIEQSRVSDLYSAAEISTLKRLVDCPRCSTRVGPNIWIYEHRFSDVEELERSIEEVATLGERTPFLILEHGFAKAVLQRIRDHAAATPRMPLPSTLFRARSVQSIRDTRQMLDDIRAFGPAPAEYVVEGRFNHAGSPMLYLATSAKTALLEIGIRGAPIQVAELRFTLPSLLVLDLVELDQDLPSFEVLAAISCSALLAAPRTGAGWVKKQYIFSRFVADCAKSAGFDALRYGSTKDAEGSNYVLLSPGEDIASIASPVGSRTLWL